MSKYASENSQIMSFYNLSQSDCQKKPYKIEENIRKQQKEHFDLIVYYLVMPILILVVGRLCWYVILALCLHFIYQIYDNKSMQ